MLVAKRLDFVPKSAKIRDVDTKLLGDYVYQVRPASHQGVCSVFFMYNRAITQNRYTCSAWSKKQVTPETK